MKYARLFEPCRVGKVELPNRIVMPPCTTMMAKDGFVTESTIAFYAERGRGGAGCIMVEDLMVDSSVGRHAYYDLYIDDDKFVPGLRQLVHAIKDGGAKASLHLSHAGRRTAAPFVPRGLTAVAPSAFPDSTPGFGMPRELGIEEVVEIEDKFAEAALRAKQAGFDIIGIHGAHGYLINSFLSPASNFRNDDYGGDFDRRLRFLLEIIRKIKANVGDEHPLMVRIPGEERVEGGLTLDDSKQIARRLEEAGVDCISVSVDGGMVNPSKRHVPPIAAPMRFQRACMVPFSAAVKQAVSVPVMTANRIVTPQLAEDILEQSKADLIGIGRGIIADPEWPKKAREGLEGDIRHCIACNYCLHVMQVKIVGIKCALNPLAGRENEARITLATRSKKVFIAGGGPAGLEAARVSALRGHTVYLFEKEKLGGQLNLACIPPGKDEIKSILDFEERQISQLGVKVEYKELTFEVVMREKPDAVIVATGARQSAGSFLPGVERKNVLTTWQVLKGEIPSGRIVVIGGGQAGAETAEFLAALGNKVTLTTRQEDPAADMYLHSKQLLMLSLADLGVQILTQTTAKEITENGVLVECDGKEQFIEADTLVMALPVEPSQELAEELKGHVAELYLAGDCVEPRDLAAAIEEGFQAAMKL